MPSGEAMSASASSSGSSREPRWLAPSVTGVVGIDRIGHHRTCAGATTPRGPRRALLGCTDGAVADDPAVQRARRLRRRFRRGFAAANARSVRAVTGGVVRVAASAGRRSPSSSAGFRPLSGLRRLGRPGTRGRRRDGEPLRVAVRPAGGFRREAGREGAGVLFSYGNYAGDVLNFDAAEAALHEAGIAARTVTVTDDISSAGPTGRKRRGIAGGLFVFKCAGAAADRGDGLDEVFAVATRANERTRSFGVAFSGATLPGAGEPLFTVPDAGCRSGGHPRRARLRGA